MESIARCIFWTLVLFAVQGAVATLSSSSNIAVDLERRVVNIFEDMHNHPVSITRDGGNIQVRTRKSDGNAMMHLSEIKRTSLHPDQFKPFLQNFQSEFPKVNAMCQNVKPLTAANRNNGHRVGVKSVLKFPFPLTDRLMIHWKYLILDRCTNEHMLFLSEEANDELLSEHHTARDKEKYVLGRTFLCAYWIRPLCNDSGEVVGSRVQYLFSGDTGGRVPKHVENAVGPKTALDSIQGLIKYVERNKI
mmetsp:Transcript_24830/g.53567  ORF Transcript_24830/g.53567 Transcript_24830/m.53567 type:complete len:248 (-) Transcript_24830:339-1082(-)